MRVLDTAQCANMGGMELALVTKLLSPGVPGRDALAPFDRDPQMPRRGTASEPRGHLDRRRVLNPTSQPDR